jgi:heme A synthase
MTSLQSEHPPRPGWVTLAVVLMYIGGILQIGLGILALFLRYDPDVEADGIAFAVTLVGTAIILFGLFVVALASGVARGSRAARVSATVLILLGWALSVVDLVIAADGDWTGVLLQTVLVAAVALPLWAGGGRRYFARR